METAAQWVARISPQFRTGIAAYPGHEAALRRYFESWLTPAEESATSRSLRHLTHFMSAVWVFSLDVGPGGMTFSRLSELLDRAGLGAGPRARPMLLYLRFIGYIEPVPQADRDGRVKRWRPTARMSTAFRQRLKDELAVTAVLDEAIAAVLARFDDDAVFGRFMLALGEIGLAMLTSYETRMAEDPEEAATNIFSKRVGGMVVMAELLLSGGPGAPFPASGPVRFSLAGLARRSGISRMNVRRMLAAAEAAGLLTRLGEGEVDLDPGLGQRATALFAFTVHSYGYCARRALEEAG